MQEISCTKSNRNGARFRYKRNEEGCYWLAALSNMPQANNSIVRELIFDLFKTNGILVIEETSKRNFKQGILR